MTASRFRLSYLGLLVAMLLALGCDVHDESKHSTPSTTGEPRTYSGSYPIKIVCTTGQIADMLRNLGGEHVEVVGLMGPGVDPHLYREVPSDVAKLDAADIIFFNGLHLEGRIGDVFTRLARRKPVFAVTQSLEDAKDSRLRKPAEFEGYYDPHVWHDPMIWSDCVQFVGERLAEFDPTHADQYRSNSEAYQKELEDLDHYCREQLATIPESHRVLVTAHDAFGYFCRTYGLVPMGLKGVSTEDEVDLGRMGEVVRYIVEHKIPAVFVESAVAPRIVEALVEPSRAAGHDVKIGGELYADALGRAGSDADTEIGMVRANVHTIVTALRGNDAKMD